MKKTIKENADGTFTAIAGVRAKRCQTRAEAEGFLSQFSSRRHVDPVDSTYDRALHGPNPDYARDLHHRRRWV